MTKERTSLLNRIAKFHGNPDWVFDPNSWDADIQRVINEAISDHDAVEKKRDDFWFDQFNLRFHDLVRDIMDGKSYRKTFRELPAPFQEGGEG